MGFKRSILGTPMVIAIAGVLGGCPSDPQPTVNDAGQDAAALLDSHVTPDSGVTPDTGAGTDAGQDAGMVVPPDTGGIDGGMQEDDAGSDAGMGCPPLASRPIVNVSGEITTNTTWTCQNTYRLSNGVVYVVDSVLTIEAGTWIRGQVRDSTRTCLMMDGTSTTMTCTGNSDCAALGAGATCGPPAEEGTALVVTRGARLEAVGTADQPIVFTSDNLGSGTAPIAGNWGGVVLLGGAPTNLLPNPDQGNIEGLPPGERRGVYGGMDTPTNREWDCGRLSYVRIEYAGYRYGTNNELNGLTLGGCGSMTELDHIQVHYGLDDGIEFFGGNANLQYAIVTATGDDSLDWDQGYSGNVQFFIAQQRGVSGEDRCIEADTSAAGRNNTPLSNPTVLNFSCFGAGHGRDMTARMMQGMDGFIFKEGSAGTVQNSLVLGSPDRGIRVQHGETAERLLTASVPRLLISNNILFDIGPDGMSNIYDVDNATTRTGDELEMDLMAANRVADVVFVGDPWSATTPNFVPTAGGPASMMAAPLPAGTFWVPAAYIGAVEPGTTSPWYEEGDWVRWDP